MFRNMHFTKYLDPETIRKNGTWFRRSKAVDYYNVNNNFVALSLYVFSLIMHISNLPNYLFPNYDFYQNCFITKYKI